MGFRNGSYATVWSVEKRGNLFTVNLSTSRKNRETGEYETDFSDYVLFVGKAGDGAARLNRGDRIKIGDCEATTRYNQDTKQKYHNYAVFSFEPVQNRSESRQTNVTQQTNQPQVDDDPF